MNEIDEVLKLPSETDIVFKISQFIWNKIDYGDDYSILSEAKQTFMYIYTLDSEVYNGGFEQYFWNSAGANAHEALNAFKKLGADKSVEIINRAILLFPALPISKDIAIRREIMQNINESISCEWKDLDDEYYSADNIDTRLIHFVNENKSSF